MDDAESRVFVGRRRELDFLGDSLALSSRQVSVSYVCGPTGVGKSGLLRAFARSARAAGAEVVIVDGGSAERDPAGFATAMARQLNPSWADGASATLDDVSSLLVDGDRRSGLVVVIDDYDRIVVLDRVLRERVFQRLEPGVCLVLAGHLSAAALWPFDPGWRSVVRELRLSGLSDDEAIQLLKRRGCADALDIEAVTALTAGRPSHLATVADTMVVAAARNQVHPGSRTDTDRLTLRVLEHMLHPASLRHAWRAGIGSSAIDRALAAVSLVQRFNRGDLIAMIGRVPTESAWATLIDLPFVEQEGPMWMLNPRVRRLILQAVARQRPWAELAWRRRALDWRLATYDDHGDGPARPSWPELAELARDCPWYAALHPPAERRRRWHVAHGARSEDADQLTSCFQALWGSECDGAAETEVRQALCRVLAESPEAFVVARDDRGAAVGFLATVPLSHELIGVFDGCPSIAERLRRGMPSPGKQTSLLLPGVLSGAQGSVDELLGAMMREVCDAFHGPDLVVAAVPSSPSGHAFAALLESLAFSEAAPDRPGNVLTLELTDGGYPVWLRRVLQAPALRLPKDVRGAAKEALSVMHKPEKLMRTTVARYLAERQGVHSPSAVRAWMVDAMSEVDAGSSPISGSVILTLYYVDRVGSHDLLAERLNIARPTYFRYHRQALERFGMAILR